MRQKGRFMSQSNRKESNDRVKRMKKFEQEIYSGENEICFLQGSEFKSQY